MKRISYVPLLAIAAAILNQACTSKGEGAKSAAAPPAKVDNRVKESELTKVTLTPEAAKPSRYRAGAVSRVAIGDTNIRRRRGRSDSRASVDRQCSRSRDSESRTGVADGRRSSSKR